MDSEKTWIEIALPVDDTLEEIVSPLLLATGAVGCQMQKGVLRGYYERSEWSDQKFQQIYQFLSQLKDQGVSVPIEKLHVQEIKDQDWNAEWKKNYLPIEIGNKFIIKPSWITLAQLVDKEIIQIDPQMAFGTGTHETTQLVIKLFMEYGGMPRSILDIGTGSGILAIAAARFFKTKIFAFDNDLTAAATARQNCIINGVKNQIEIFCSENLNFKNKKFDLILANISRTVILDLLLEISTLLAPRGRVIFSGILFEEKEKIITKLNSHRLDFVVERRQSEWVGLVAEKFR